MHSVNTALAPREVPIAVGDAWLYGDLVMPLGSRAWCCLRTLAAAGALEQVAQLASSRFTTHLTFLQNTA